MSIQSLKVKGQFDMPMLFINYLNDFLVEFSQLYVFLALFIACGVSATEPNEVILVLSKGNTSLIAIVYCIAIQYNNTKTC